MKGIGNGKTRYSAKSISNRSHQNHRLWAKKSVAVSLVFRRCHWRRRGIATSSPWLKKKRRKWPDFEDQIDGRSANRIERYPLRKGRLRPAPLPIPPGFGEIGKMKEIGNGKTRYSAKFI
jgi:hypothetical protein